MRKLRKPLSVLLSLVMVLGVFSIVPFTVSAQAAVTYIEYSWNGSALETTEKTVTDYTVVNSSLSSMTNGTYVVNADTTIEGYVTVQKGATANLVVMDGVTLTCNKGIGCGLNKNNEYASLNIFGTGKIVATGKGKAAGIGGDNDETNGSITIHGTTIEATGGKHGAGIGGGEGGKDPDASSPIITIYDGNITATGGIDGAGIGGGDEQPGARTYIYGGTIDASSKKHGAGIGGGDEEGTFGIWIYGGTVTATGGYRGAGIGAGEEGGNLRKSPDGGVNILGGTVTATGGSGGAGVGGGYDEDMSGTIDITGEATKLTATGGIGGAGIGAGKGKDGDWCVPDGDMSGTITIDCGEQSDINIFGGDEETDGGRRSTGGAGIGAGFAGNQYGKVYIRGGNIVITGGAKAAGIGGGKESDSGKYGGEGGDVYIGGGNITIYTINTEWYNEEKNHAIGSGFEDIKDGSVYIHANNNTTGRYMRVDYMPLNKNDFKTASTSQRSKKAHTRCTLHIQECNHKDYYGKDGLTKKITPSQHIITCKYCGYTDQGAHESETYCFCGYNSENCCTVTLHDTVGSEQFKVLKGGEFILPDYNGAVSQTTDIPEQYYRVSGWTLNGDASGKVYEQGEEVIANSDMTFTTQREALYKLNFENVQHGSIHADITNNEAYASAGETIEFGVEADPGYSVSNVTYKMMTGYDLDDNYNVVYLYSDPVEIQPVEGIYRLTMPESTSYNNMIVISAEVTENMENPIGFSEDIENGTVTSDRETAAPNDTVTLTVTPDAGYFLDELRCKAADGTELELTQTDDTHYTFTMPAMSVSVSAEFELADDFTALQALIDSTSSGGTVTLALDYTARDDESCLTVPSGKTITLDLNGHDIDRDLDEAEANGNVITNNGALTITGNGTVTGGKNAANGGAILNNGTLTLSDGVTISGNSTTEDGGAIYNSGTLTIDGGTISNNISTKSGGAISAHSGTITINGGEIKNNRAGSHGGAIYLGNKDGNIATLNLRGGTITGNTVTGSDSQGGGICDVGTLNVSGNPVVKNNTAPAYNKGYNIYLRGGKKVNVTGELTDGAEIGVTAPGGGTGDITSGLSGKGTADSFFSDVPDCYVGLTDNNEATLHNMGAHLAGHSISLEGDIAVNFYMQLDSELASHESVKMQFTVPGTSTEYQDQKVYVKDLEPVTYNSKTYYVFKCRVAAKNMDSQIQAQLIDGENRSTVYTYSVKDYADYLLDHTNDNTEYAAAAPLVRAMLTYGDNAKYYFDKTGEEPDAVKATIPEYGSIIYDTMPAGVTFTGATLSLKSQTTLSLYFESNQEIELTCPGYTTKTAHSDREYVIRIRDIAAMDLNKEFTVKVNGADAVTYSPLTYCYKAQTSSDAKLVNTVKALYNYHLAAKDYF